MEYEQTIEFVTLNDYPEYEILSQYPFTIRKKENNYEVKECFNNCGYIIVNLNQHPYEKHKIIAKQFIPNDDPINKNQIDHLNHIKTDNRIENLRWVSRSENQRNKLTYHGVPFEFVDSISEDAIEITTYGKYKFEGYFFHDNVFYFYNGIQYKKLNIRNDSKGNKYVKMSNINGKTVQISYLKFKKLYNID